MKLGQLCDTGDDRDVWGEVEWREDFYTEEDFYTDLVGRVRYFYTCDHACLLEIRGKL